MQTLDREIKSNSINLIACKVCISSLLLLILPVFVPYSERLARMDFLPVVVTWTFFHKYTKIILILVQSIWTCASVNGNKVNIATLALRGERKTGTLTGLQLIGVAL